MSRLGICIVLILGLSLAPSHAETEVVFLDNVRGQYFKEASDSHSLTSELFSAIVTSLLNLPPISDPQATASYQVADVIKVSPFDAPHALLSITIAGLKSGAGIGLSETAVAKYKVQENDILKGLSGLQNTRAAEIITLDATNLPGCRESCLEQLLQNAVADLKIQASYNPKQSPFRGNLTVHTDGGEITFDLDKVSDRVFAMELASLWATVEDTAKEKQRRVSQSPELYHAPQLLLRALISPQAIKETYGVKSLQYAATSKLVNNLVSASVTKLQNAYNDRLAGIITFLDSETLGNSKDFQHMLSTSTISQTRRSLLADQSDSDKLESFIAWIAMWSTFFLLLFFAITGCHCLKSMKFKQDSLLYGKNKSD